MLQPVRTKWRKAHKGRIPTVFDLFYTRLFIRNAVPAFGSISTNPRSYFPLKQKDFENV